MATDPGQLPRLSYSFARQYGVVAKREGGAAILLRRADTPLEALLEARRIIDSAPARIETLDPADFEAIIAKEYAQGDLSQTAQTALDAPEDLSTLADSVPRTSDLLGSDDDAPVIRLINGVMQEAIRTRASDIHIEPYENRLSVRFRIDGALTDILNLAPRVSS